LFLHSLFLLAEQKKSIQCCSQKDRILKAPDACRKVRLRAALFLELQLCLHRKTQFFFSTSWERIALAEVEVSAAFNESIFYEINFAI